MIRATESTTSNNTGSVSKGSSAFDSGQSEKVVAGNSEKLSEEDRRIAGFSDIFLMNLGIILSGVVFGWNGSLYIGIGEYLISLGLCTLGYICLALCVSEMAGIIAFSGGSYGYARCTLSPFIGYLVGMCDLLQCVMFTASTVFAISQAFSIAVSGEEAYLDYLPLWWIAIYGIMILIGLPGGRILWDSIIAFVMLTIVMLLLYVLGCASLTNFSINATREVSAFAGNGQSFMNTLIVPTICYIGVDLITVFGDEVKQPERNIPYGMLASLAVTILFAWWVTLTVVSVHPGVSAEMMDPYILFPMHFGFETLFSVSNRVANFLMAPTMFSAAIGFLYAASRQMYSMSKSGLLPSCLSISFGQRKTPVTAMITTSVIGFIVLIPIWVFDPNADDLYELCMIGACCVYISMFWCYFIFSLHYSSMDRTFKNPLGLFSAIYGMIYFLLVLFTLLFAQLDFNALCAFVPYIVLAIIYYYQVVEKRQFFSKEEQKKFMKAYILNANRRKKQKMGPMMQMVLKVFKTVNMVTGRFSSSKGGDSLKSGGGGSRPGSRAGSFASSANQSRVNSNKKANVAKNASSSSLSIGGGSVGTSIADGGTLASPSADTGTIAMAKSIRLSVTKEASLRRGEAVDSSTSASTALLPLSSLSKNDFSGKTDQEVAKDLLHKDDVVIGHVAKSSNESPSMRRNNNNSNKIAPIIEQSVPASTTTAPVPATMMVPLSTKSVDTIQWSGKFMNDMESRKFFEILHTNSIAEEEGNFRGEGIDIGRAVDRLENGFGFGSGDDNLVEKDVEEDLLRELPGLFIRPAVAGGGGTFSSSTPMMNDGVNSGSTSFITTVSISTN